MLDNFDSRGLNGTDANGTGFSIHRATIAIPTTYKNPMGLAEIFASNYCMNFSMKENFFIHAYFSGMFCLKRVCLNVRVKSHAQDFASLVVDNCGNVLLGATHFCSGAQSLSFKSRHGVMLNAPPSKLAQELLPSHGRSSIC